MQAHRPLPRHALPRGKGGLADENASARLANHNAVDGSYRPRKVGLASENTAAPRLAGQNIVMGAGSRASRIPAKDAGIVKGRAALGEVTFTNINLRKQGGTNKDGPKRTRAGSVSKSSISKPILTSTTSLLPKPRLQPQRISLNQHVDTRQQHVLLEEDEEAFMDENVPPQDDQQMDDVQEEPTATIPVAAQHSLPILQSFREEEMVILEEEDEVEELASISRPSKATAIWPNIGTEGRTRAERQLQQVRDVYDGTQIIDPYQIALVSEYCEEIFEYMRELEPGIMPSPDYVDSQPDIDWATRQKLVDWISQVHLRYHLMPETLWIAVNIIDRFLSKRTVSVMKLQLVGVTSLFIAAKYEEIMAPSVKEFVHLTNHAFTQEEIFKGERIILETIGFNVSGYCSPYTWMRKISRADDYDLHTRTLGKFLSEVTLLDHRFLRASPHLVAAVSMYTARIMLEGDWDSAFIYTSDYTEEQLIQGHHMLLEKLTEHEFARMFVCKKYANKRFLKASIFAVNWARVQVAGEGAVQAM